MSSLSMTPKKDAKASFIINLKAYTEGCAKNALKLCKICDKIQNKFKHCEIMIAAQAPDIFRLSQVCKTKIIAQHVDLINPGAHTGKILFYSIKEAGAKGVLINHSEFPRIVKEIYELINECKKNKLYSIVCAINDEIAKAIAELSPDFIAIEPPELIGTKTSVSRAKPNLIKKSVSSIKLINPKTKVLCGAGIHTKKDVSKALELDADGILVASAIVKAKDPANKIIQFCEAIEEFFEKKKKY